MVTGYEFLTTESHYLATSVQLIALCSSLQKIVVSLVDNHSASGSMMVKQMIMFSLATINPFSVSKN